MTPFVLQPIATARPVRDLSTGAGGLVGGMSDDFNAPSWSTLAVAIVGGPRAAREHARRAAGGGRAWTPQVFALGDFSAPATRPGDTDPDAAAWVPWAAGAAPPGLAVTEPDAACPIAFAAGRGSPALLVTDPDAACWITT